MTTVVGVTFLEYCLYCTDGQHAAVLLVPYLVSGTWCAHRESMAEQRTGLPTKHKQAHLVVLKLSVLDDARRLAL